MNSKLDQLAIDTLRVLSVEAINQAKSGHPGIALGAAPIIHTLYSRFMRFESKEANWVNRDRFVLSAGHGSSLLYSLLYLCGFIALDDLKSFRQLGSLTPGHPESHLTRGVDVSTGPLGQGFASAVGLAIAEAHLHAKFNNLIDHYTYVLCGDGDLQEGVTLEAASLAGHLGLSKLIVLFDSNDIQLDGPVLDANAERTKEKFESMNWNYLLVEEGTSVHAIEDAIREAQESDKPTIIEIKTIIGFGAKNQGTSSVHGAPLSEEEVQSMREKIGLGLFEVSREVNEFYKEIVDINEKRYRAWEKIRKKEQNELFEQMIAGDFTIDWENLISFPEDYNKATRVSSGAVLNELSKVNPMLIGGSADLSSSTNVRGADGVFLKENRLGRDIKFGVREHAMAAVSNGIALHKGLISFCSGFFVFSDYMKPAIRLSAIQELPVIYIFTHDSVAVGEDGPTHQPIEQLTMLRSIPNLNVIRPADAAEVKAAYKIALESKKNPTVIVLTRQNVPMVSTDPAVDKGAYVLSDREDFQGILLATGSEVSLAMKAQKRLDEMGHAVRVVSMPSLSLFEQQDENYKEEVLPSYITKRLALEMGEAGHLYRYVGLFGKVKNITEFGKSGKGDEVVKSFGYDVETVVTEYLKMPKIDIIRYL